MADGQRRVRIGHAEREAAAQALAEHFTAGRLTPDEYATRSDAVTRATVAAELSTLFTDLPRPHPPAHGLRAPARRLSSGPGGRLGWPVLIGLGLVVALALTLLVRSPLMLLTAPVVAILVHRLLR